MILSAKENWRHLTYVSKKLANKLEQSSVKINFYKDMWKFGLTTLKPLTKLTSKK